MTIVTISKNDFEAKKSRKKDLYYILYILKFISNN